MERRGRGHRSDQVVGGSGAGLQAVISLEKVLTLRRMNVNSIIRVDVEWSGRSPYPYVLIVSSRAPRLRVESPS